MTTPIRSKDYDGQLQTLVDEQTLAPVKVGDVRCTFRGERFIVTGGRAPHKPESTGKVWCRSVDAGDASASAEFYPGVISAKWV
jgi:hypothetical protein